MSTGKPPVAPLQQQVTREFELRFGASPMVVVRAPGRVNLIGEHTDYNDGFVLPMAIDRAVWIALRPRDDTLVRVHSLNLHQAASFRLQAIRRTAIGWVEYLKGVAWAQQQAGHRLRGWEGVLGGDVPVGAGLSSSAALEMATARAFAAVSDLPWDAIPMAKLCQQAESHWVGVRCGVMDQIVSATGRAGHALLIDCRSLETQAVPMPTNVAVAVLDTGTRRDLVNSGYNERRAQCEAAARFFGVRALRDVSIARFEQSAPGLDDMILRRAQHVITENTRTLRAAKAMRRGDMAEMGRLTRASHVSLRDDFEVSSDELNAMVDCAAREPACYGARITGAGFAGCAVALVRETDVQAFAANVAACYQATTGLLPRVHVCTAASGAEIIAEG
jgi:galactokinase